MKTIFHTFEFDLAKRFGVDAAIMVNGLARKLHQTQHFVHGAVWIHESISSLWARHPYFTREGIRKIVGHLVAERVVIEREDDRTPHKDSAWLAINKSFLRNGPKILLSFQVAHAVQFGVPEAILIEYLDREIEIRRRNDPRFGWVPIKPCADRTMFPFDSHTLEEALKHLVAKGVLEVEEVPNSFGLAFYQFKSNRRAPLTFEPPEVRHTELILSDWYPSGPPADPTFASGC